MLTPANRFDDRLTTLGIPIDGVSGSGPMCRIDFKPEASAEQRDAARAAALNFDWTPGTLKTIDEIFAEVPNLTTLQRTAVLNRMIADYLFTHPKLAIFVGINPRKT